MSKRLVGPFVCQSVIGLLATMAWGGPPASEKPEQALTLGVKSQAPAKPAESPAPERKVVKTTPTKQATPNRIRVTIPAGGTIEDAWDARFAKMDSTPDTQAAVRETVRQLMGEKKHDEVVALLQSALRTGQAQPWMYEALAIALQVGKGPQEEIERALMSAPEFAESPHEMLVIADYLARSGFEARALAIYRDVSTRMPLHPGPYVKGLGIAQRINDADGIEWACLGIMRQAWPKDEVEVAASAYRSAFARLTELEKGGKKDDLQNFKGELRKALHRDCVVQVTWTGDADVDVMVEEPSGTICSLHNPRTTGGGVFLGDSYGVKSESGASPGTKPEGNSVGVKKAEAGESYVCTEGFSGEYKVLIKRVWGKVTGGTVTVDVYTHWNGADEVHFHRQVRLDDKNALVKFELKNGRRQEAVAEEHIANIARKTEEMGREIVNRVLDASQSSYAAQSFAQERTQAVRDGRLPANPFARRRGPVGFTPLITTLPEGATLQATAVVSADRRYVRISPMPIFSQIGQVDTFTFSGGTAGGGQQGQGGGQLGGGGGQLGGGGGGGLFGGGGQQFGGGGGQFGGGGGQFGGGGGGFGGGGFGGGFGGGAF